MRSAHIFKSFGLIFAALAAFPSFTQTVAVVPAETTGKFNPLARVFTEAEMLAYERASFAYSGLSKVISVDNTPSLQYSETEFWPEGSWGRGYATEVNPKQFYEAIPGKHVRYYSAHPLMRVNHFYLTAHIYDYLSGINKDGNLDKIKKGIDNVLLEQRKDGMFTWWGYRQSQTDMNSDDYKGSKGKTVELNEPDDFESTHGLNLLCEYYNSGIDYRRGEVLDAIRRGESGLLKFSDFIRNTNNNYRGMGIWALSGSYRITGNRRALSKINEICGKMIEDQGEDGLWHTGGLDGISYNGQTYEVFHDSKIFYHFLSLRGLTEAFGVLTDVKLKARALSALKKGINHVIGHRINPEASGFLYAYDLQTVAKKPETVYMTDVSWYSFFEPSITMDALVRIYKLSVNSDSFTREEAQSLLNLVNIAANWMGNGREFYRPAAMYNYFVSRR